MLIIISFAEYLFILSDSMVILRKENWFQNNAHVVSKSRFISTTDSPESMQLHCDNRTVLSLSCSALTNICVFSWRRAGTSINVLHNKSGRKSVDLHNICVVCIRVFVTRHLWLSHQHRKRFNFFFASFLFYLSFYQYKRRFKFDKDHSIDVNCQWFVPFVLACLMFILLPADPMKGYRCISSDFDELMEIHQTMEKKANIKLFQSVLFASFFDKLRIHFISMIKQTR